MIEIYTDGGCRGNPGPGGWGVVIIDAKGGTTELNGYEAQTTNNRMELTAAIKALETLTLGAQARLTTDSNYVKQGISQWVQQWKKNGWKTAQKKQVLNQDLWQQLDALNQSLNIEWQWVKGHSGHAHNERCDELANLAMDGQVAQPLKASHVVAEHNANNNHSQVERNLEERLARVEDKLDAILQRLAELS
ncbi:Ribonuclease HI [Piscirickettsia salmonis]|uniref:Ribonuclease H n=1 Tax=Piscirickettsia salmonis TaxID=1238 RepID=A0A1L6TE26_PISSA|nr:ribonuclease HI [Piscirickettsia salmonis]AKP72794.1 ribonuclease H [Piscirickettsia salmonis LF-89 = ATCC VR-1361]ALB23692.1 RNaseH ribonuclease [Piscirickettsia salmonis]ALY03547.1 ribonuclease H [Piscirickettsia salmonis]AMA43113.1 ribonuclease H [Piscirickettsia salmonis]AOS35583.1 ribonuclease H [Piscirickettsia salmonis]